MRNRGLLFAIVTGLLVFIIALLSVVGDPNSSSPAGAPARSSSAGPSENHRTTEGNPPSPSPSPVPPSPSPVPSNGNPLERHIEEAIAARVSAEEAGRRLQEAILRATAAAAEEQAVVQRATAIAMVTREAVVRTRQAVEIQATVQALSAMATRHHLEAMATANAQALSAEATRRAIEATRQWDETSASIRATVEAYGLMPTATAIARAQDWEERERQNREMFIRCVYGILLTGLFLAVGVGIVGLHRILNAWAMRIRAVHGQDGRIYVIHIPADRGDRPWPALLRGLSPRELPAGEEPSDQPVPLIPGGSRGEEPAILEGKPATVERVAGDPVHPDHPENGREPSDEPEDREKILILEEPARPDLADIVRMAEEAFMLDPARDWGWGRSSVSSRSPDGKITQLEVWRLVRIASQLISHRRLPFPFHRGIAVGRWVFILLDPRHMSGIDPYRSKDLLNHLRIATGRPVYVLPSVRFRGDWFGYAVCLRDHSGLPDEVEFPGLEPDVIRLGVGPAGEVRLGIHQLSHCLIAGNSQFGKTNLLRLFIVQAIAHGMNVEMIDPRSNLMMKLEHPRLRRWQPEQANDLLVEIHKEMERRDALLMEHHVENLLDLNRVLREQGRIPIPRILVALDELEQIRNTLRQSWGAASRFWYGLMSLLQQSKRNGIHVVAIAHIPNEENIGSLRHAFEYRFAFQLSSASISESWLGRPGAEKLNRPGLVMSPNFGIFQAYRMSIAAAEAILHQSSSPIGTRVSPDEARILMELASAGGKATLNTLIGLGCPERRARRLIQEWTEKGVLKKIPREHNAHYVAIEIFEALGLPVPDSHPEANSQLNGKRRNGAREVDEDASTSTSLVTIENLASESDPGDGDDRNPSSAEQTVLPLPSEA